MHFVRLYCMYVHKCILTKSVITHQDFFGVGVEEGLGSEV